MDDTLPLAEIVHVMPGRARLRIAERRGDSVFFASLATGLSAIAGVSHVEVRPLTGSILVEHAGPLARIGTAAARERLFVLSDVHPAPVPTPAMPIDPRKAVAAGLGIFALWQLLRGRVLPPAITLAWYAAVLAGVVSEGDFLEDGE
jgi:hypothetical protein